MKPKKFIGFRGIAMRMEVGSIQFYVLANNITETEALHQHITSGSGELFNPEACTKAILVQSAVLPEAKKPIVNPDTNLTT